MYILFYIIKTPRKSPQYFPKIHVLQVHAGTNLDHACMNDAWRLDVINKEIKFNRF